MMEGRRSSAQSHTRGLTGSRNGLVRQLYYYCFIFLFAADMPELRKAEGVEPGIDPDVQMRAQPNG